MKIRWFASQNATNFSGACELIWYLHAFQCESLGLYAVYTENDADTDTAI